MFSKNFINVVVIGVLFGITTLVATDIKGKVNAINSLSKVPYSLKGVDIDLYSNISKKWVKIDSFITDGDGMYYFKGVKAGSYTLQVNGKTNYPIDILETSQQELPPILIHYK